MENQNNDTKPKMLFNSDGFEFFIKCITVLFTILVTMLIFALKVFVVVCDIICEKKEKIDPYNNFVSTDITKTPGESRLKGTGYYK